MSEAILSSLADLHRAFAKSGNYENVGGIWYPISQVETNPFLRKWTGRQVDDMPPLRVAVFGSFHRGLNLLKGLTSLPEGKVEIVGLATDNPDLPHAGGKVRIWRHEEAYAQKNLVPDYAAQIGVEPYFGKVKSEEFYDLYENVWKPDIAVMGTFGQLINQRLIDTPRFGFYNFHPIGHPGEWREMTYAGPQPFETMLERGDRRAKMVMHEVTEEFDAGIDTYESAPVAIPPGSTPVSLHAVTSPLVQDMVQLLIKAARANMILERDLLETPDFMGRDYELKALLAGRKQFARLLAAHKA